MNVGNKKIWEKEDLYDGMEVIHHDRKYLENGFTFIIDKVNDHDVEMINMLSFQQWYNHRLPLSERITKDQSYRSWKPSIKDVLHWLNTEQWYPYNYKQKEPYYECW